MDDKEIFRLENKRSEEINHIIEKMPTSFGFYVTLIISFIFILLLLFGFIIRYPDIVIGQISLTGNVSSLKIAANFNGKIVILAKSNDYKKEGEVIAYLENSVSPKQVCYADSILSKFSPDNDKILSIHQFLPKHYPLGELNGKYSSFVNSLQEYSDYRVDRLIESQRKDLNNLLSQQKISLDIARQRIKISQKTLEYLHKFYSRDSLLLLKKVISEAEFDKTQMTYISGKDALENAENNKSIIQESIQQTISRVNQLTIQDPERERLLKTALTTTYNDLRDNIKIWEQKYVFKAPFNGHIQFLKFYNQHQFVMAGEELFSVIPEQKNVLGQVVLPANGSGKVKVGQEVIVKLDDYPFLEYGSLKAKVSSIALSSTQIRGEKSNVESYLIKVDFPFQLKTNYGSILMFKPEAKGTAEIITNDRKLVERFFDNLRFNVNK